MRHSTTNLGDLAASVLDAVEREQLGKTAPATYTSNSTDVGEGLRKLASALRDHQSTEVTYEDLAEFRRRHAI